MWEKQANVPADVDRIMILFKAWIDTNFPTCPDAHIMGFLFFAFTQGMDTAYHHPEKFNDGLNKIMFLCTDGESPVTLIVDKPTTH